MVYISLTSNEILSYFDSIDLNDNDALITSETAGFRNNFHFKQSSRLFGTTLTLNTKILKVFTWVQIKIKKCVYICIDKKLF